MDLTIVGMETASSNYQRKSGRCDQPYMNLKDGRIFFQSTGRPFTTWSDRASGRLHRERIYARLLDKRGLIVKNVVVAVSRVPAQ